MKKNIITSFKYGTIIFALFGGLLVFAYTQPVDQSQNAFKPVTTDSQNQTMESPFSTTFFLKAGNTLTIPTLSTDNNPTWNGRGYIIAEKNIVSPKLFVDRFLYLGTNKSQVKIGGSDVNPNLPPSQPFTGDMITPLIIDMNGRATGINSREGREVMELYGSDRLTVSVNTPAIQFSSTANPAGSDTIGKADVIAKSLQLDTPPNYNGIGSRVLVATDNKGNATWGTMKIVTENGIQKIKVNYPGSPVADGQNSCGGVNPPQLDLCTNIAGNQATVPAGMIKDTPGTTPGVCTTPPVDLCPNIAGTQTTVPAGMALDTNGNCVTPPVVDLCTNIAGNQTTVPAGMIKDTPGTTPGVCTTPPVDMCPNIAGTQITVPAGMALDTNGNCVTDMCPNITGPQSTVPAGYYVDGSGSCLTLRYWTVVKELSERWMETKPPGSDYNQPAVNTNTSSPYFHVPYCSVVNYHPGDKYYRDRDSVCTEHSVVPDPSAWSETATPVAQDCPGTTYSQPCNP